MLIITNSSTPSSTQMDDLIQFLTIRSMNEPNNRINLTHSLLHCRRKISHMRLSIISQSELKEVIPFSSRNN